jgi:Fur family peroxide stress response transcriptional regulator
MGKEPVSIDHVKSYLMSNGIHPSYQRLKIYQMLAQSDEHPTVDMIYQSLTHEIPTLSKTTIYNTLNLFQRQGIVMGLTIEDNELRFDANTVSHAHFKCTRCGQVLDVSIEYPKPSEEKMIGIEVTERQFYMKGICADCSGARG